MQVSNPIPRVEMMVEMMSEQDAPMALTDTGYFRSRNGCYPAFEHFAELNRDD